MRHNGIAVHFLDLDRFKHVKTSWARRRRCPAQDVAERLRAVIRIEDVVARLGGDEFVVVQTGIAGKVQAEEFARRLISALTRANETQGSPVQCHG